MLVKEWVLEQIDKIDFDKNFVTDDRTGKSYSYSSFFAAVIQMNALLETKPGIKKIIPVMENSLSLFALYFVCMLSNRIIVPIDSKKGANEIQILIKENEENSLVIESEQDELFEVEYSFCEEAEVIKQQLLKLLKKRDFENDYLISFTSGTSGNSKGVRHSLNDLFLTSKAFNETHAIKRNEVFGHLLPMTYMAGILNSIIKPFVYGNEIVILGRFDVKMAIRFWGIMSKYSISMLWLTPTMLNMIYNTDRGEKGIEYCSNSDLLIFVGTAPLTLQLKNKFEEKYQIKLYISYGLTETLFISVDTDETHDRKDGNVGKILPGVRFADMSDEALLDVDWMFLSYTNEDTSHYFEGTFYKSGDLVEIKDGTLYIVGRKKDLIIKGGMNISPASIENELVKLSAIREVAVFGRSDDGEEKIICAYVAEREAEQKQLQKEMNHLLHTNLGKAYTIDEFYLMQELIYNINGKKDIQKIKERIEEGIC